MGAAGIIVEYNPLHSGHLRLLEAGRAALGPDTAMVCVMSGNFVQRGDFALLRKHARARAAVESGADLVARMKERGYRMIATGEMGIGNTTAATAVSHTAFSLAFSGMAWVQANTFVER